MKKYLFTTFHNDKNPERNQELRTVLDINLKQDFEKIYLFGDDEPAEYLHNPKIVWIKHEGRTTFGMMLSSITSDMWEGLYVFSNADIFFKQDVLQQVDEIFRKAPNNFAMANSRWDIYDFVDENNFTEECLCRVDSQDWWVTKGVPRFLTCSVELGRGGCDNVFAYELNQAGYVVRNLAKSLKGRHLHITGVRNYVVNGVAIGSYPPPYLLIDPVSINDLHF